MSWNDQQERYAACQTFGHAWIPQSQAKSGWTPDYGHGIVLSCDRCGCERRDTIDLNGDLSARSYDYPAGYRDAQRPTRAQQRVAWMTESRSYRRRARSTT